MKKRFQVYVLLNNHLTSNKVDYPSDEYINMLCSNQQNLINDINENINKLNVITNKISESENYSKELLSEIKRLEEKIQIVKNEYQIESMNLNSNLKSIGFNKLKEEDFIRAEFLFENAIKQNILDYDSYVGYFLSINKSKDLINLLSKPILDITLLDIYIQATEILTGKQKETIVEIGVKVSLQYKYIIAMNYFNDKSFKSALDMFSKIPNYQDSLSMIDECNKGLIYCEGLDFFKNSNYEKSLECFERVCDFLDSRYYIDLNKTNISKQKYKEEILGKKRMLLKADKFFKNLMFDDAIEIYENLQCIEELKKIKEFKELYQLFIKYVNFEVGGEKLLDYNKDNELFIEVSRYFPDCFNIRNTEIFNIFAKQYFEKTYIDIIKEINIIEEKINMYERNIVVSALLFAAFNKPFLDLENQIVNFIDQFPIESDYYKIMIYEYSKCNYKINILERI